MDNDRKQAEAIAISLKALHDFGQCLHNKRHNAPAITTVNTNICLNTSIASATTAENSFQVFFHFYNFRFASRFAFALSSATDFSRVRDCTRTETINFIAFHDAICCCDVMWLRSFSRCVQYTAMTFKAAEFSPEASINRGE